MDDITHEELDKALESPLIKRLLEECCANKELINEYARLTGYYFQIDGRTAIERAIDEATSFDGLSSEQSAFLDFCLSHIILPAISEAVKGELG